MPNQPTISILLLCMNHAAYIPQCLESINQQTEKNLEIIFLDNCSSDGSAEVFKREISKYNIPYQIFENRQPQSVPINLNILLGAAKGEFVTPFSCDDWMRGDNLEKKIFSFDSPDIGGVLGSGFYYFEDTGETMENTTDRMEDFLTPWHLLLRPRSYFWCGPVYRKKFVEALGGWDENLLIEDLDMNIRMAKNYKLKQIKDSLVYYRRHSKSFSSNFDKMYQGYSLIYKKYLKDKTIPIKKWFSHIHIEAAKGETDRQRALKYFYKGFIIFPGRHSFFNLVKGLKIFASK